MMHSRAGAAWIRSVPSSAKIALGSCCSLSGQGWERLRTASVSSALHKALRVWDGLIAAVILDVMWLHT